MKKLIFQTIIKLGIVSSLIVASMEDIPDWYYILLRLFICSAMALTAYILLTYNDDRSLGIGGCVLIFLLYNPIFKPHYTKEDWDMVDWIISFIILIWGLTDIIIFTRNRKNLKLAKQEAYQMLKKNASNE